MIEVLRRYRYVIEDRDRYGNIRVYLRQPGKPKRRLREIPGTPEFEAEYRQALAESPPMPRGRRPVAKPGSLRALCQSYLMAPERKQMEPRSLHVRRLILDRLCDQHGDKPHALMERKHVRILVMELADRPEAANARLKALRAVFHHGMQTDQVNRNIAAEVPYLPSKPGGHHSWTIEEVRQFEVEHPIGTTARLAVALLLYTGQRRSDVVKLGRQNIRQVTATIGGRPATFDALVFTQTKNRRRKPVTLTLPIIPELRRIIDASRTGDLTFLVSEHGTPWTVESFGNAFRKWCRQADLPHCSAHGVRKATGSRLADLGCTPHEIAAVLGHRTLKEVVRYTAGAAQTTLAANALAKLGGERTEGESVPPSPKARPTRLITNGTE